MSPGMDAIAGGLNLGGGSDPLAYAMTPPANETEDARRERLQEERRAKQRSDAIDEEIEAQRIAAKKGPKPIKILLLGEYHRALQIRPFLTLSWATGQSESGMSCWRSVNGSWR
jgi:hypothetical protein